jgi:hypothetical protein
MPMTGFAFILFTFYMITDPATSPAKRLRQVAFGCAVALGYAAFMELHVVFGLFYALTVVTAARGGFLYLRDRFPQAELSERWAAWRSWARRSGASAMQRVKMLAARRPVAAVPSIRAASSPRREILE